MGALPPAQTPRRNKGRTRFAGKAKRRRIHAACGFRHPTGVENRMTKRFTTGLLLSLLAIASSTAAAKDSVPTPVIKNGSCPAGYYTSGKYCTPTDRARTVIEKKGSCPPGYFTRGNYCAGRENSKLTVPKAGACPPGYSTRGNYCVKN